MQLEMWLWKKSSLSSSLQWARVGGGSYLCRREKGQIVTSETSKRNQRQNAGLRPKRNTGPANRTHRNEATGRGAAADLRGRIGGSSHSALMKLMVASHTLRYMSAG